MSVLSGPEIQRRVEKGEIVISPFNPKAVGPHSVNLTLDDKILIYEKHRGIHEFWEIEYRNFDWKHFRLGTVREVPFAEPLDLRVKEPTVPLRIPEEGFVLYPGLVYLAATREWHDIPDLCGHIDGRSSVGRMGLFQHVTAGYIDGGFRGNITLELVVPSAVRVYPFDATCQISFSELVGESKPYDGRYQDAQGVEASKFHEGNT